ncbi:MAG: hypothetical protein PF694_05480 [Bacteroidetes bacterium]|jgi:hypothetical protein|nr:hypothetical protein [Bacteroidota bacterium]
MKFYDVDARFTFGKYEGLSLAEVFAKDPKYIDYCNDNIDEFYVSKDVLKELKAGKLVQNVNDDLEDEDDQFSDEDLNGLSEDVLDDEEIDWEEDFDLIDDDFDDDFDIGFDDDDDDDF